MWRAMRWIGGWVALSWALSGCGTAVEISSRPPGAEVIMDRQVVLGRTPILLKEQAWLWTSHTLTLRKEGYVTEVVELEASSVPSSLIICLCLWPLWPLSLQGSYGVPVVIEMERGLSSELPVVVGDAVSFSAD
jgi:hypothetical protein